MNNYNINNADKDSRYVVCIYCEHSNFFNLAFIELYHFFIPPSTLIFSLFSLIPSFELLVGERVGKKVVGEVIVCS
ncbi:MAG: hypothetical protein ACI8RD_002540 [Bacillariaceae sp.]|jgi:hypothetical protein